MFATPFVAKSSTGGQLFVKSYPFKKSSSAIMPAQDIDPEEYHVFDNACLEPAGLYEWTVRVKSKWNLWHRTAAFKFRVFYGGSEFIFHKFTMVHDQSLYISGPGVQTRRGTYMLLSNTHANNYHIINDFSLLAFRALFKIGINGLLVPEGCVDCWSGRLPVLSMGLDMMNLSAVYPLENATSLDAPMCFDRLIIHRFESTAYYMRKGRFSTL
jgi:hypothetical protein